MKVLVTGGAGFVGANLCLYLKEQGLEPLAFDNLVRRGSELNLQRLKEGGVPFLHGDVRNVEDLDAARRAMGEVEAICETAAQPSAVAGLGAPAFDVANNLTGLCNCLDRAQRWDSHLIFWSTNKVYSATTVHAWPMEQTETRYQPALLEELAIRRRHLDHYDLCAELGNDGRIVGLNELLPVGGHQSIYGATKAAADLLCQEYMTANLARTTVNRFSCLAGPCQWGKSEQGWVAWWCIAAVLGLPVSYIGWQGKQVRDILHVNDLCRLVLAELHDPYGNVYNVGGGPANTASLVELTAMLETLGYPLLEEISQQRLPRYADHCWYVSSIQSAEADYGWQPAYSVQQTVEDILRWVVDNQDMLRKMYL